MPPKQRTQLVNYPKYVNVSNHKYIVYRPRIAKKDRHLFETDKNGFIKPIRLGVIGDDDAKIHRAYLAAHDALWQSVKPCNTLYWISNKYQDSRKFKELSKAGQSNYLLAARILDHEIKLDGVPSPLGDLHISFLEKPIVTAIMEKRLVAKKEKGLKGEAIINREAAYLSSMLTWATNNITDLGVKQNPLIGLRKFSQGKNERYVTDAEYATQLDAVKDHPYLLEFFEIAYLCACRTVEVRDLNLSSIAVEGLLINRRKGSSDNTIEWSDRLRLAVDSIKQKRVTPKITRLREEQPLFTNREGERITQTAINSAMQTLKKKMSSDKFWTLHMLKHKGVTDSENKHIAGHKDKKMIELYNHERPTSKPVK